MAVICPKSGIKQDTQTVVTLPDQAQGTRHKAQGTPPMNIFNPILAK